MDNLNTPEEVREKLVEGNKKYVTSIMNPADISQNLRDDTANNGQSPYAVILTCSDSRVPPEHIFSAGLGDLFVVRTAGNVVGDFELGSIEYGVEHLGVKVIVVMGHSKCGAVAAALGGHAGGYITSIVEEIKCGISGETDVAAAENKNIVHSVTRILESECIRKRSDEKALLILKAKYNIQTGEVRFLNKDWPR